MCFKLEALWLHSVMEKAASSRINYVFDNAVMPEKAAFFYHSINLFNPGEKSGLVPVILSLMKLGDRDHQRHFSPTRGLRRESA